eukprot:4736639-Amphidinium_carterae.1
MRHLHRHNGPLYKATHRQMRILALSEEPHPPTAVLALPVCTQLGQVTGETVGFERCGVEES